MKKKIMSLDEIRTVGTQALYERLGPVGMVRFLQQFDTGSGDYTEERSQWLSSLTFDEIVKDIKR
ncbi:MAG: hypothetical protein AB2L14_17175 [Candidatus Xenobiia bacterium LiM19]